MSDPYAASYQRFSDVKPNDQAVRAAYEADGIIGLESFVDEETRSLLIREMALAESLAEAQLASDWHGERLVFYSKDPRLSQDQKKDYVTTDYFQRSAQATHIFYEDIGGQIAVNRIGHGMHLDATFPALQRSLYQNPKLLNFLRLAGYRRPICHLSVYIPKLPHGFGSDVRPHQESTFAYTEPQTALVLWLALEDATVENACMWGIPGSHKMPLKYISRVDRAQFSRRFETISDAVIPEFDADSGAFNPLPVRAGSALLFHGNYVHCSPVNHSSLSRPALSFQFIETDGVSYPSTNWLQPLNDRYLFESCGAQSKGF